MGRLFLRMPPVCVQKVVFTEQLERPPRRPKNQSIGDLAWAEFLEGSAPFNVVTGNVPTEYSAQRRLQPRSHAGRSIICAHGENTHNSSHSP
jgi:hypothetical protein